MRYLTKWEMMREVNDSDIIVPGVIELEWYKKEMKLNYKYLRNSTVSTIGFLLLNIVYCQDCSKRAPK